MTREATRCETFVQNVGNGELMPFTIYLGAESGKFLGAVYQGTSKANGKPWTMTIAGDFVHSTRHATNEDAREAIEAKLRAD